MYGYTGGGCGSSKRRSCSSSRYSSHSSHSRPNSWTPPTYAAPPVIQSAPMMLAPPTGQSQYPQTHPPHSFSIQRPRFSGSDSLAVVPNGWTVPLFMISGGGSEARLYRGEGQGMQIGYAEISGSSGRVSTTGGGDSRLSKSTWSGSYKFDSSQGELSWKTSSGVPRELVDEGGRTVARYSSGWGSVWDGDGTLHTSVQLDDGLFQMIVLALAAAGKNRKGGCGSSNDTAVAVGAATNNAVIAAVI